MNEVNLAQRSADVLEGWKSEPVDECLTTQGIERRLSIPRSAYRTRGKYPVIDQGQAAIAGFTDDDGAVHRDDLPLLLFGDHTRAVKYLDFPFATGADGTKLLRPRRPDLDARFLYYALLNVELPSRGYNRHFGLLCEQHLGIPENVGEQRAIAGVLSKLQAALEVQDRIVPALKELKAATMAKLFREGLRGEALKQTEIGEIPESWEVVQLGSVVDPVSGGTPSKGRPEWWQGSIPWASPKDMKRPRLYDTEDHISAEALAEGSRLVPAKTVFVVTRGMILAKDLPVAIAEVPMAFNQDMRALLPTGAINGDFLLYAITVRKDALASSIGTAAHGTRRLGSASLETLALPKPGGEEQRQIAEVLSHLEIREELAKRQAGLLRSLFETMLASLVTGRLRVQPPAAADTRS
jgi:type I restriction enzyme S subunit